MNWNPAGIHCLFDFLEKSSSCSRLKLVHGARFAWSVPKPKTKWILRFVSGMGIYFAGFEFVSVNFLRKQLNKDNANHSLLFCFCGKHFTSSSFRLLPLLKFTTLFKVTLITVLLWPRDGFYVLTEQRARVLSWLVHDFAVLSWLVSTEPKHNKSTINVF